MPSSIMPTYARLPIRFSHGKGVYLYTDDGARYLDALAGIAVNSLGHAHPRLVAAISEQAHRLIHVSNLYEIAEQEKLANQLTTAAGMDNVFFCNSGAEANEAAIKLARLYGHEKGIALPNIIVAEGAFHGRTLASLTATGNARIQQGFEPLVEGFVRVPFDDIEAIRLAAEENEGVVAVLLEPVQGEGGIRIPRRGYLEAVERLCRERGWLFMLDEVQTGIGRTGKMFAFEHDALSPDVVTLAKGLGGGFPIGACLAKGEAATVLTAGKHGSTFGGNPLACAAASTVLDTIADEALVENAATTGKALVEMLKEKLGDNPSVTGIRGIGLMIAIELDRPCAELVKRGIDDESILINVTAERVVRLLPPLILDRDEATAIADKVASLVNSL